MYNYKDLKQYTNLVKLDNVSNKNSVDKIHPWLSPQDYLMVINTATWITWRFDGCDNPYVKNKFI
jgi:hypothetical protein